MESPGPSTSSTPSTPSSSESSTIAVLKQKTKEFVKKLQGDHAIQIEELKKGYEDQLSSLKKQEFEEQEKLLNEKDFIESLEAELVKKDKVIDSLTIERSSIAEDLEHSLTEKQDLRHQLLALEENMKSLSTDNSEIDTLKSENDSLKSKVSSLEETVISSSKDNSQMNAMKSELDTLKSENTSLNVASIT